MEEPKKPVLPFGWVVKQSKSYPDRVYYFNVNTGNSTWEVPSLSSQQPGHVPNVQNLPAATTKSCLSKPSAPRHATTPHKKSVKIAPDPQFSPEIDEDDDDMLDLTDDGATSLGHKHHMEILNQEGISNINPFEINETVPNDYGSQLEPMQDVDMRRHPSNTVVGEKPGYSHVDPHSFDSSLPEFQPQTPAYSSDENTQTIIKSHFNSSTFPVSSSKFYNDRTLVSDQRQNLLKLPVVSVDKGRQFSPLVIKEQPSYSNKDLSSSLQTLPSVDSSALPKFQKFSSTPIDKRFSDMNRNGAKFPPHNNTVNIDENLRITRIVKNEADDIGRKRRLSELWNSQKGAKKVKNESPQEIFVKCGIGSVSDQSSQKQKKLSANDLRHKVQKKQEGSQSKVVLHPQSSSSNVSQSHRSRIDSGNDIRKVVSDVEGCEFYTDELMQRDLSPDDNFKEEVKIDPDKLLSIQTWIDNLEPGHTIEDEDAASKRTSPDSAILSVTYSNDSDNRRIVVEKGGHPQRAKDSGISSVSNFTAFHSVAPNWKQPQIQPNTSWKGVHAVSPVVDHTREVMDMEIDEVQQSLNVVDDRDIEDMEVINIVAKEVRAKFSTNCNYSDVLGDLTKILSEDTALTTSYSHHQGLLIVVDTNILISHLNFIQDLRDTVIQPHGRPILVFPWVVMQELDYLKSGKAMSAALSLATASKARQAVQYLYHCLQSSHPRIVGQTPAQASMAMAEFRIENNDDRVLQCCKQFQNLNQDCVVVLLTDDRNLCNKSLIMGIKAFTHQLILTQLPTMEGIMSNREDFTESFPSHNKMVSPKGLPVPHNNVPSATLDGLRSPELPSITNQTPTWQKTEEASMIDDMYCKLKTVIKLSLSYILEREMKKTYEDIWLTIVYRKPPWTLLDVLECIKKHWIAVFGQIYRRDLEKCVQQILDVVKKDAPMTWTSMKELIRNVNDLFEADLAHMRPNPEIVKYKGTLFSFNSSIPRQSFNDRNISESQQNQQQERVIPPLMSNTQQCVPNSRRQKSIYPKNCNNSNRYNNGGNQQNKFHHNRKRNKSGDFRHQTKMARKSPEIKQELASEIKFKAVLNTIRKICDELKQIAASNNSPQRRVYQMCDKLVPAVKDLEIQYNKSLSIPPAEIRTHFELVIELGNHLNSFHDNVDIEDTTEAVDMYDLLELFASEEKRKSIVDSHRQLKQLIKEICVCLEQLPDD